MKEQIPFTKEDIEKLSAQHKTPFYVYDEAGIRNSTRALVEAFSWNTGFKEYFAVKALPNPAILTLLQEEGCGADCSSLPELMLAEQVGMTGEQVILTTHQPKNLYRHVRSVRS
jgi:diaminopimelate decarboxylase